jgi:adenine phosphoribosyltransferase
MPVPERLKNLIRDVPDFPKPGIVFKDITPLLADPSGLSLAVELMSNRWRADRPDLVVGTESRGFIFGTAVAQSLSCGFVPIRKPGKLPHETVSVKYDLEYGSDEVQMHVDAVKPGQSVLMVDDLIATGGTMRAACDLVTQCGARILGVAVLIELTGLGGRDLLEPFDIHAQLTY